MSLETLLAVLSDGEFHSGDELGSILGVSRTAIWKQLKKVEELGLTLDSVKGKGYCLVGGVELLDKKRISQSLSGRTQQLLADLELFSVIESTNTYAMEKAAAGVSGYVCSAEQQTAGKGRRGRPWVSPYAGNIYLSTVWEFSAGAVSLEGLSLAVGVAVVDALSECGINGAQLKWPNDVLYDGKKLAGILLEMSGDPSGPCQVVVGIGLNVAMPAAISIDQPWVDTHSINAAVGRNQLLASILNQLLPLLSEFEQNSFSYYRERWQQLDGFAGSEVAILLGEQVVVGREAGVDKTGAVLLETEAGLRSFNGGEISLRERGGLNDT